jgi:hypothetical protein
MRRIVCGTRADSTDPRPADASADAAADACTTVELR